MYACKEVTVVVKYDQMYVRTGIIISGLLDFKLTSLYPLENVVI